LDSTEQRRFLKESSDSTHRHLQPLSNHASKQDYYLLWYRIRVTIPSSQLERLMTSPEVECDIKSTGFAFFSRYKFEIGILLKES
jgi:phosphodiesterase/alkaline phosphatase D-like protein